MTRALLSRFAFEASPARAVARSSCCARCIAKAVGIADTRCCRSPEEISTFWHTQYLLHLILTAWLTEHGSGSAPIAIHREVRGPGPINFIVHRSPGLDARSDPCVNMWRSEGVRSNEVHETRK